MRQQQKCRYWRTRRLAMTALAMPVCAQDAGSVVPSMFTVRVFLISGGYSDGGTKWNNAKLFPGTQEKKVSSKFGRTHAGWRRAFLRGNIEKNAGQAGEIFIALIRIKFAIHDLVKRPRTGFRESFLIHSRLSGSR